MFALLEQLLLSWANVIPLEIFAVVASFVEEIIPPIPSPSVNIIAGSIAQVQGYIVFNLFFLSLFSALGKTMGASIIYFVSDKVENIILRGKFAKFIGVTHEQIESLGSRLGKGSRDWIIMTFLRALPIIPSVLVSVGGGLLKVPFKLFIITTFIGSIIRAFVYIYLGYVSLAIATSFAKGTTSLETIIEIVVVIAVVIGIGYMYWKRSKKI